MTTAAGNTDMTSPSEAIAGTEEGRIPKPLSLRLNFSWAFVGNAVEAGCKWGMLVVLAKCATPEILGRFTFALAVATPVFVFTDLNLRSVQATDVGHEFLFKHYLGLRLITIAAAMSIVGLMCLLAGYQHETAIVLLLIGLTKAFESLSDVFFGLFLQRERVDYSAKSIIIRSLASLLGFAVGVHFAGLSGGILALVATRAALVVLYDIRNADRLLGIEPYQGEGENREGAGWFSALSMLRELGSCARLAVLALPLGAATVLASLIVNVPTYFIAYYFGEQQLGYFSALSYTTVATNMFVRALGTSMIPSLARSFSTERRVFLGLLVKAEAVVLLVGFASVVVVMFLGKEILQLAYTDEYAPFARLFTALTIVSVMSAMATVLSLATTSARLFMTQLAIYSLNLAFVLGACWTLVPRFGLWGVVYVLGASALFRIAIYFLVLALRSSSTPPATPSDQ